MKLYFLITALIILCSPLRLAEAKTLTPTVDLSKSAVKVNTAFIGTEVLIFGTTEGAENLIVVISGPSGNVLVRKKKRVSGIWVNRENVIFQNVPVFYAVASTRALSEITEDKTLKKYKIGADKLFFKPASGNKLPLTQKLNSYRDALIRRKEADGLFTKDPLKVDVIEKKLFKVNFNFPNNMATGKYTATIFLFQNKRLINSVTKTIRVERTGIGSDVFQFAHNQSALYGILAIVIAVLSGWIAAAVFRRL